jgi:hypothetical protein
VRGLVAPANSDPCRWPTAPAPESIATITDTAMIVTVVVFVICIVVVVIVLVIVIRVIMLSTISVIIVGVVGFVIAKSVWMHIQQQQTMYIWDVLCLDKINMVMDVRNDVTCMKNVMYICKSMLYKNIYEQSILHIRI